MEFIYEAGQSFNAERIQAGPYLLRWDEIFSTEPIGHYDLALCRPSRRRDFYPQLGAVAGLKLYSA